ncbi:MAG: dihydrodipicolinate synthase family protein [Balneolaceae bacterium]
MQVDWKGVYPAITTKFHKDGSLDLSTFEVNIKAQLEAGIHGIVLGGTLGEASTLQNGEKIELLAKTRELVGNDFPVILNIAEQSTDVAMQTARDAENNGVDGLMLLPPMRYKADDRETVAYFKAVASATSLPIMIYNNPIDYGIEVTHDMFEELSQVDNIEAVKESTRDVTNVTRMINRFGDRFKIMCGVDTIALDALLMGAHGWVAGLVCAFPRETVAIYELAQSGEIQEALEIFRWFLPLLELDINPKLVQNIKLAEVATGIGTEFVRSPRLMLQGEERKQVQKIIDDSLKSHPEIEHLLNKKTQTA